MGQTEVFINSLQQTGPVLLMPAAVFLVCLFLRIKPGRALLSSLNAAIGLVGVSLLISMIGDELETAMQMMSARFGLSLAVLDIGWAGTAPAAWASPIGALAIPLAILINMVMLASGLTRTVNIDIWNIWHMAFTGAIAFVVTGSYAAGIGGMKHGKEVTGDRKVLYLAAVLLPVLGLFPFLRRPELIPQGPTGGIVWLFLVPPALGFLDWRLRRTVPSGICDWNNHWSAGRVQVSGITHVRR